MGDLNADAERYDKLNKTATKGKFRIISLLQNCNLIDTQKVLTRIDPIEPTWVKPNNINISRRIDYI